MIPRKRTKPRRRDDYRHPSHRAFIRKHHCSVPGCPAMEIVAAHVRSGLSTGAGGTGRKPHDAWTVPLCHAHHDEQHATGERSFERKYAINLRLIAKALARQSPVAEVREFSKGMNDGD